MEIGNQIKTLRTRRGLTQEALACALNVTAQTVSKWECGTTLPDIQLLPQISVYFGVSIDELFALTWEERLERMAQQIEDAALLTPACAAQLEEQLVQAAAQPALRAKALTLQATLHNHQAVAHRVLAGGYAQQAAELDPQNSDAISEWTNAMGSVMPDWNAANHHELIDSLKSFLSRHPESTCACMWLLDNLLADGRLAEAQQELERLQKLDSTYRTCLYRGMLAQAKGETGLAQACWKELEERWSNDWGAAFSLADLHARAGRWQLAVQAYRRALQLQQAPRFADMSRSIAHICEICGDFEGAAQAWDEVLQIYKEDWGITEGEPVQQVQRELLRVRQESPVDKSAVR